MTRRNAVVNPNPKPADTQAPPPPDAAEPVYGTSTFELEQQLAAQHARLKRAAEPTLQFGMETPMQPYITESSSFEVALEDRVASAQRMLDMVDLQIEQMQKRRADLVNIVEAGNLALGKLRS